MTEADQKNDACQRTTWNYADLRLFPRRRIFLPLRDQSRDARYDDPPQSRQGPRPRACRLPRAGRSTCRRRCPTRSGSAPTTPGRAPGSRRAATDRMARLQDRLRRDEQLGREPRRHQLWPHRRGSHHRCCSMLRIPVAMHNVPEEKIFRPACWGAFGTKDLGGR